MPVEQFNDEQLMLKVKSGQLDSLAPLFEKYHVKLYNFFLRLTRNRDVSRDLTQNVFRRILSYRETYDARWPFRTWMYQVARNVHLKYCNENKMVQSGFFDTEHLEQDSRSAIEEMDFESQKSTQSIK